MGIGVLEIDVVVKCETVGINPTVNPPLEKVPEEPNYQMGFEPIPGAIHRQCPGFK